MYLKGIAVLLIFVLTTSLFSGCINNDLDYKKYSDIQYKDIPNIDPNLVSFDIYIPKVGYYIAKNILADRQVNGISEKVVNKYASELYNFIYPMPVMIWVHGGGWRSGDKDNQLQYKIPFFIDEGWIFVSVNYRLSPAVIPDDPSDFDPNRIMYPIHNQDVAAAIAWVHENIDEYGGNPDQISIMGHSAGAGIVAAIGTNQTFLQEHGLNLSTLKNVVCLDTEAYDVRDQIENGSTGMSMLYMNAFGTNPSVWDDASPQKNIEPGEKFPPFFIVTRGSDDRINLSERFINKLNTTGTITQLIYALEYTHEEVNDAIGNPKDNIITPALKEFLNFFIPDAPFVGTVNGSYIDPEFNNITSQITFQDYKNRLWIGDINKETGIFLTTSGCDFLMDENICPVFDEPPNKWSTNGPEWTKNENKHYIVYTKKDNSGIMQQWLSYLDDGVPVVYQLTTNTTDCYGNMPSRFLDGKPPCITFTYNWPIWYAKAAWIFADKPWEFHNIPGFDYNYMSMWSAVSSDFLFVIKPEVFNQNYGQIAKVNADTGDIQVLTNDSGDKDDPGLFVSPEFNSEILLVTNVDNSALGIYRDMNSTDGFWTRVATLYLPDNAPYRYISSVEIIAPSVGIRGVSYFTLLARQNKDKSSPGSIWVFGLGNDSDNHFVRRVDDGAINGLKAVRMEPESFVAENEVFIYYNFYDINSGKHGLRRARTGIDI